MFKSIKRIILIIVFLSALLLVADFAMATNPNIDLGVTYGEDIGLSNTDPRVIAANIIRIILGFLGILAVGLMIYAGFLWMTASGDENKIDTAKKIIVSAIIGLVIILSAFAIATFLLNRILNATGTGNGGGGGGGTVITPTPRKSCDGNTLTPVCDADDNICDQDQYCNQSTCTCRNGGGEDDPCDTDTNTPSCEADNNLCAADFYCSQSSCVCKKGSGLYEACNATTTPNVCEADQNICNFDLTCDTNDCFCKDFPIIKSITPQGGFCESDPNRACAQDSDCQGANPVCNIVIPNAARGNIITIEGSYFGTSTGQVLFWDGSGFNVLGLSPSALNPNCNSNWQNNQIIIVVPSGALSGPILIRRADNAEDTTDNSQGPLVEDLLINNIVRPGLCRITPEEGNLGNNISYYGINFSPNASEARFGILNNFIAGKNSVFLSGTAGTTGVPSIDNGKTSTFVSGNGRASNYLQFNKLKDQSSGPYITSFEPLSGASGQYVTIYGSGFGYAKGTNKVYFGDEQSGIEADYNFPDVCLDSIWSDNQIIIKVPENGKINDGNYELTVVIGSQIINTSALSPTSFIVDNNLLLAPSLCKITPVMGQVLDQVSLWGEYFEDYDFSNSKIRFYNNKDMSGADISFWDVESDKNNLKVYRAQTVAHAETITGPVKVVKGNPGQAGNGLNFKIGNCLEAEDSTIACGGQYCCGADTYKAGRCVVGQDDCKIDIPNSVYEWDFSTDPSIINPDDPFSSCAEKSKVLGICDPYICPNSPGSCSFYGGSQRKVTGDCSYACEVAGCGDAGCFDNIPTTTCAWFCSYNSNIDKCVDDTRASCDLPITVSDPLGNNIQAHCGKYQGNNRRVLYINTSCPSGWTRVGSLDDEKVSVCVDLNSTCSICRDKFSCLDDRDNNGEGVCAAAPDICSGNSVCENDNKCREVENESCECCCRINNQNEDCCVPLECAGNCGSDRGANDTNTHGYCSGCRADVDNNGSISASEQIVSDQRCVCGSSQGKYCDVDADVDGDGNPEGICLDCGQLADEDDCSDHSATCCVDAVKGNKCRGGLGDETLVATDNFAYCQYYECDSSGSFCENNPVATSSNKYFNSLDSCIDGCQPAALLGKSCSPQSLSPYSTSTNIFSFATSTTCNLLACSSPFACMTESGFSGAGLNPLLGEGCGICCCDPSLAATPNDSCKSINNDLVCQPNKEPCSGARRGLCCGCEKNTDCLADPINSFPEDIGCGLDSCCHARAEVERTVPADGAEEICPNAEIRVEFNQKMDAVSFSGNVFVAGEYAGTCPAGTVYLASVDGNVKKQNIIIKTFYRIVQAIKSPFEKIFGSKVLASDPPKIGMNYCAVYGSVDNEQLGNNKTILRFLPASMLDTGRKYFVILKGDADLDNKSGILNYLGIGMNTDIIDSPVDNTVGFNGIIYKNSYVWSFTTLKKQSKEELNVCKIDHVSVSPNSYLFQTTINDLNENDGDSGNKTFDTVKDSDKRFISYAFSSDGQILFPVSGYSWNWVWSVDDSSVANVVSGIFPATSSSQLARATDGATDKRTKLNAEVDIIDSTFATSGDGEIGKADIQVFVCENPWPSIRPDGSWYPWIDTINNCLPGTGPCLNTNYLLYYCRDQGEFGTVDDLPSVLFDAVTRGVNGELLKESYFFREEKPQIDGANLQGSAVRSGGAIEFDWDQIIDPSGAENVSKYKLYYGEKSGVPYAGYEEIPAADAPYVSGNSLFRLEGLKNNTKYYFSLTAVYENGQESDYSSEFSITPADTLPPVAPTGVRAKVINSTSTIEVYWNSNTDEVAGYVLYYGHIHANPGKRIPENRNQLLTSTYGSFNIVNKEGMYFITVTAVDKSGNESDMSSEIVIVPEEEGSSFENTLTNVNFEAGAVGGVPTFWGAYYQSKSRVGISDREYYSGSKSLHVYQAPNIPWPGVCGSDLINRVAPAYDGAAWYSPVWTNDGGINYCDYPDLEECGSCRYAEGQSLGWPDSNNVMFANFHYDVSHLNWEVGKRYLIAFYYRGRLATPISPVLGYSLNWLGVCTGVLSNGNCLWGWPKCSGNPNHCCDPGNPNQVDCFDALSFETIPAGNHSGPYNGWNLYLQTFTYTPELQRLINPSGSLQHLIGAIISYTNTGAGSDFYIDDFIVAEKAQ